MSVIFWLEQATILWEMTAQASWPWSNGIVETLTQTYKGLHSRVQSINYRERTFAHLIFGLEQKLLTGICPEKRKKGEHHEVRLQNTFLEDLHFETGSEQSAVIDAHFFVIPEVDKRNPLAITEFISLTSTEASSWPTVMSPHNVLYDHLMYFFIAQIACGFTWIWEHSFSWCNPWRLPQNHQLLVRNERLRGPKQSHCNHTII